MPQFVLYCIDGDRAAELRPVHRPAHLAHLKDSGMVRLAGPMTDEAGKIFGSLLIVEAEDIAAARVFSGADPFRQLGVWDRVEIHAFAPSIIDMPASA